MYLYIQRCINTKLNIYIYILKERGFVNGAIGQVESLLVHKPNLIVFTMLLSTGVRVLVHPITERGCMAKLIKFYLYIYIHT